MVGKQIEVLVNVSVPFNPNNETFDGEMNGGRIVFPNQEAESNSKRLRKNFSNKTQNKKTNLQARSDDCGYAGNVQSHVSSPSHKDGTVGREQSEGRKRHEIKGQTSSHLKRGETGRCDVFQRGKSDVSQRHDILNVHPTSKRHIFHCATLKTKQNIKL